MAWETFLVSGIQPELIYKYDPALCIDGNVLSDFIDLATEDVKDTLLTMIYTKYREFGKTIPDDLPAEPLDTLLSASFSQITKKIMYRTLMYINENDPIQHSAWQSRYSGQTIDQIFINVDIDSSGDIDSSEFIDAQYLLDSRMR